MISGTQPVTEDLLMETLTKAASLATVNRMIAGAIRGVKARELKSQ